jgi:hypothetical protein
MLYACLEDQNSIHEQMKEYCSSAAINGIYKVLVCRDDREPQIVESRHVTFDESIFPGANCLLNYLSDEHPDDSD